MSATKEIQDIVRAFHIATHEGKRSALATVVHVEGSSYRRPGARMLVTEDGQLTGAISGGCLEGDALRKALLAIHQQQNKLVTYDTSDEGDMGFGIQLGCNGIVHILFEPLHTASHQIGLLEQLIDSCQEGVLVTLFSFDSLVQPGLCGGLQGRPSGLLTKTPGWNMWEEDARAAVASRCSILKKYSSDGHVLLGLIEFVPAPISLVVAGAGNDVLPLMEMTRQLGWHVTVVDGRRTHATRQRFPAARKIIVSPAETVLGEVAIHPNQYFVLMTHNYNYDLKLLATLISHPVGYIGVLGPRSKWRRMLEDLSFQGIVPSALQLQKIHAPVGLDLGAETAEEIALSIIAEIKAVSAKVDASFLREKHQPIHTPPDIIAT